MCDTAFTARPIQTVHPLNSAPGHADIALMQPRPIIALLLLVACAPTGAVTTAGPSTTSLPTPTVSGSRPIEVGAGVIWEVETLTDLGLPTSAWARTLYDLAALGDRLIAVGRDGGDGLVVISDDQGETWRRARVEAVPGAESSVLSAVTVRDGVLVAVGEGRSGCPDPNTICDLSLGAAWISTDRGETWSVADAPTLAQQPSSFMVDVTTTPDGLVAIGNVDGPSPASALLWTSPDGLVWSEGMPLPPTYGGFSRVDGLMSAGGVTLVSGGEVLCEEWYDNGFWVFSGAWVEQARVWSFDGATVTPLGLEAIGLSSPPVLDCSVSEPSGEEFLSRLGELGLVDGSPAVFVPGVGLAIGSGGLGEFRREDLDMNEQEGVHFVEGAGLLVGTRPGVRGMVELRSWVYDGGGWKPQPVGLPAVGAASGSIGSLVWIGGSVVGVGSSYTGVTEGLVWRSRPGELVEDAGYACEPAPGADCRGVDLSGADLSGLDLAGIDLRHADLSGANLSGADLTGARFTSADLYDVELAGAVLRRAHLVGVRLSSMGDEVLDISGADFTGADLRGARVELGVPAIFDEVLAETASFTVLGEVAGASFRNAALAGAFFTTDFDAASAVLRAVFDGADLSRSYFDVDVTGSSFAGVDLSGLNFGEKAVCPDGSAPVEEAYGIRRCPS